MKTKLMLMIMVALSLVGCEKQTVQPPVAGETVPAKKVAAPVAAPAAPAGVAVASPGALLTEEKVKGFVVYTREIAAVASEAMGMMGTAFARSKGDRAEIQRQMSRDERTRKLAEASQAALTKAGLTQPEATALSRILTHHYAKRMGAVNAAEALSKSKAAAKGGKPGMLDAIYQKQVDEGQAVRAEFEKTHGKAAMAVVDLHEKEYLEAQQAMLKAAFKRPGK